MLIRTGKQPDSEQSCVGSPVTRMRGSAPLLASSQRTAPVVPTPPAPGKAEPTLPPRPPGLCQAGSSLQVPSGAFWKDPGGEGTEGFPSRLGLCWTVHPPSRASRIFLFNHRLPLLVLTLRPGAAPSSRERGRNGPPAGLVTLTHGSDPPGASRLFFPGLCHVPRTRLSVW